MVVEMSQALRVLAHELRSPTGVAQGYVRMLLDGRLSDPAEQRRALEQVRDVIGRIGMLSRQASEAASWLECADVASHRVTVSALVEDLRSTLPPGAQMRTEASATDSTVSIATLDRAALGTALASVLSAVSRERPQAATTISVSVAAEASVFELLAGPEDLLGALRSAADAGTTTPWTVERGGLGLALVNAALVLDKHHATLWTVDNRRDACGVRVPLEA